jgi:4a-hydroxytetrahydrobiopterin dehydratase
MELTKLKCKPCKKETTPLTDPEIQAYRPDLDSDWCILEGKKITREYFFANYPQTIAFVNKVANLAENEGHHPVIHIYFAKIRIELWTHAIDGLSPNDFILAAKMDELY